MRSPAEQQNDLQLRDFSAALRSMEPEVPKGIVGPDGQPSQKRFSVYRNNVMVSLIDALAANFPVIQRLLGEEFFAGAARVFITERPPVIPMLFLYGEDFAEFLASFEPVAEYPYLADVARYEYAWLQSYHAKDAAILDGNELAAIAPELVGQTRFVIHPASCLLRSSWPAATIVERNRAAQDCSNIDLSVGEDMVITRPFLDVHTNVFAIGGYEFLATLRDGATLEQAANAAFAEDAEFDLPLQITVMLELGVFMAINTNQPHLEPIEREYT